MTLNMTHIKLITATFVTLVSLLSAGLATAEQFIEDKISGPQ